DGDCTEPACGDGFHNPVALVADGGHAEECDDGPLNSDTTPDACRTNCLLPFCGDAVTDPDSGEQCDSAGVNIATCDFDCTFPVCGDGLANAAAGEQCDEDLDGDGIADNTADCDRDCSSPVCGDALT